MACEPVEGLAATSPYRHGYPQHAVASLALTLTVAAERWPIAGSFAISRGAKTEAVVVVAELSDGADRGRGECVPYARYGESVEASRAAHRGDAGAARPPGSTAAALQDAMPPGAARNALDCALLGPGGQAQRPPGA